MRSETSIPSPAVARLIVAIDRYMSTAGRPGTRDAPLAALKVALAEAGMRDAVVARGGRYYRLSGNRLEEGPIVEL